MAQFLRPTMYNGSGRQKVCRCAHYYACQSTHWHGPVIVCMAMTGRLTEVALSEHFVVLLLLLCCFILCNDDEDNDGDDKRWMCAVYVDVRYETKGTFTPDVMYRSHSFREFIGYVIVAKDSTMELIINEPLRHFIYVLVLYISW